VVLATKVSGIFIYHALAKHSKEILNHISMLKNSDKDNARETCGSLATLVFFDLKEAENLYRSCARGDPALRRGVAEVLARNVDQPKYLTRCLNGLFTLVNDGDKSVREAGGGVFRHLPLPNPEIRRFVAKFLGSKSLVDSAREVVEYAARAQAEDSELALAIAERVQLALGTSLVDMRTSAALLDDDLVSLAISIHTRSTDPDLKDRALDLFEHVLDLGSRYARTALESVDR